MIFSTFLNKRPIHGTSKLMSQQDKQVRKSNNEAQLLLQWKSNKYYIFRVCVCSLTHPACNARAPYFNLWPTRLYSIFPHYVIHDTISKIGSYWT